jgi:hypothetical protein
VRVTKEEKRQRRKGKVELGARAGKNLLQNTGRALTGVNAQSRKEVTSPNFKKKWGRKERSRHILKKQTGTGKAQ